MATTETCPTCGNAHTGECSVAALKARIERLDHRVGVLNTRERMVLDELGFAEDVSPVWSAVLLNIRDLRGRVKVGEAERDALRAQIADLEATGHASHLLFSQRADLDRAGAPTHGEEGAPASDGWRASWAAKEVVRLRALLAHYDVLAARKDGTGF